MYGDFSNPVIVGYYFETLAILMLVFLLTHTLQLRELRRFFENKKLVKKQEQVTNVLDTQNDSIIVV